MIDQVPEDLVYLIVNTLYNNDKSKFNVASLSLVNKSFYKVLKKSPMYELVKGIKISANLIASDGSLGFLH